jgi:hypothetical protein
LSWLLKTMVTDAPEGTLMADGLNVRPWAVIVRVTGPDWTGGGGVVGWTTGAGGSVGGTSVGGSGVGGSGVAVAGMAVAVGAVVAVETGVTVASTLARAVGLDEASLSLSPPQAISKPATQTATRKRSFLKPRSP